MSTTRMTVTTITNLPVEIILAIAECLPIPAGVNSFARANRHFYSILNPYLYRQDVQRHGSTSLWWAVKRTEIGTARHALDQGADIHSKLHDKIGAVFSMAVWNMSTIFEHCGPAAGHQFCRRDEEFLLFLLSRGADINARNSRGWAPLHYAALHRSADLFAFLLKHGADINALTPDNESILHLAIFSSGLDKIRSILDQGLNINAPGHDGNTPLHVAVERGRIDIAELLLDNGADVNGMNQEGTTPLHMTTAEIILDTFKSKTADIAQLLLKRGADIEARDRSGQTPLHSLASAHPTRFTQDSFSKMYQVLRDWGASTEAVDGMGVSVFEQACKMGNTVLMDALRRRSSRLRKKSRLSNAEDVSEEFGSL